MASNALIGHHRLLKRCVWVDEHRGEHRIASIFAIRPRETAFRVIAANLIWRGNPHLPNHEKPT